MRQGVQSVRVRSGKPCIGWKPVRRRAASEGSLSLSVRSASALRGYRGAAEEGDVAGTTDISRVSPNQYNRDGA